MDNATKSKLAFEIQMLVDKSPLYNWGGSESYEKGLDCSGAIFFAFRRAGILVSRTTSINMARGRCGWDFIDIELRDSEDLDVPFWTLKPERENGHVGIFYGWKGRDPAVVHASQSRGRIVQEAVNGWVITKMTALKRFK